MPELWRPICVSSFSLLRRDGAGAAEAELLGPAPLSVPSPLLLILRFLLLDVAATAAAASSTAAVAFAAGGWPAGGVGELPAAAAAAISFFFFLCTFGDPGFGQFLLV